MAHLTDRYVLYTCPHSTSLAIWNVTAHPPIKHHTALQSHWDSRGLDGVNSPQDRLKLVYRVNEFVRVGARIHQRLYFAEEFAELVLSYVERCRTLANVGHFVRLQRRHLLLHRNSRLLRVRPHLRQLLTTNHLTASVIGQLLVISKVKVNKDYRKPRFVRQSEVSSLSLVQAQLLSRSSSPFTTIKEHRLHLRQTAHNLTLQIPSTKQNFLTRMLFTDV